jgi:hypothetical protein
LENDADLDRIPRDVGGALYAVLAMPSASARNRNQQTIVSFSVR